MGRSGGRRCWSRAALLLGVLLLGCSRDKVPGPTCSGLEPAFALLIVAEDGPLPDDLRLSVTYGGGIEEFVLADTERTGEVVFCAPSDRDGGAPSMPDAEAEALEALRCELWTDGAATIDVQGGDYPPLEHELEAEADACGIKTVEEAIELSYGAGGGTASD
jgi:hypothetical protein